MEGEVDTPVGSQYGLVNPIDTETIFTSLFTTASVTVTHLGPGTSTLSETNGNGPHKIIGATGTMSDGWHTFEFKYDDGCQNINMIQKFCCNAAPYLSGNNIDQILDIEQLYEANAVDLFTDDDLTDTLTYSTTAAWPTWI